MLRIYAFKILAVINCHIYDTDTTLQHSTLCHTKPHITIANHSKPQHTMPCHTTPPHAYVWLAICVIYTEPQSQNSPFQRTIAFVVFFCHRVIVSMSSIVKSEIETLNLHGINHNFSMSRASQGILNPSSPLVSSLRNETAAGSLSKRTHSSQCLISLNNINMYCDVLCIEDVEVIKSPCQGKLVNRARR